MAPSSMEHPGSTGSPARHARPGDEQVDLLQEHSIVGNAQAAATTDGEEEEQEEEDSEHADNAPSTRWQRCLSWLYRHRILLKAALKVLALFLIVVITLGVFLASALPPIDPVHKPDVKIPRDFDDLKRLNVVLQIYKERNFARVLGSFIAVYLFLQSFSVPGSLYMSILAGAMYGTLFALPLVCLCIATGATLCYLISALLGPALLLASQKWRDRLDLWRDRIDRQGGNMISYLMILRIAPLPPHWMVNIICPHLNISVPLFWTSTFLGVMAPSFIHVQIGTTLDQMTSPSEFHLISWRNFFGLAGVVIAILVPVIVRYIWAKELSEAAEDVVEVVGDVDPEEQSSGSNDVAVIVHDDSRRNGNTKAADVEWARLRDESAIRLPEQDMPETQALRSNTASRAHADQRDSPTNSQGWPFRLFGGRKSEGKIRL